MAEEESTVDHLKEHMSHLGSKVDHLSETVKEHIATDKQYYKEIDKLIAEEEEEHMNVMEIPAVIGGGNDNAALIAALMGNRGGNDGAGAMGLGGGLVGGVLLGALLGRNGGLFGGNGDGAGAVGLQSSIDTNTILQSLGDIKASVPLAEAQVQLALAGQSAQINGNINASTIANLEGQGSIRANISAQTQALTQQIAEVGNQADRNLFQISQTIMTDGEKTRALITSNTIAELNQRLTVAQQEALELRNEQRRAEDRHGIEITMTNTQNQNNLQFQQQAQVLNSLSNGLIDALQSIRATNQAINIGTGTQTANPTNTNTNVRA